MWGVYSMGKFRRRRSRELSYRARKGAPLLHPAHEIVPLSHQDRRAGRRELVQTLAFIVAELIDNALDMANFIYFIHESPANEYYAYRVMYIFSTILVTAFSLFVLAKHITHLRHIRAEILVGIQVAKGRRSRMQRSRSSEVVPVEMVEPDTDAGDATSMSESGVLTSASSVSHTACDIFDLGACGTSQERVLELELERLQRRSTRAKLIVVGAFAEDLTTFLFALYRVSFTGYIVDASFATCLVDAVATGRPSISCATNQLGLIVLQIMGSLFLFAFKVSFVRDYQILRSITGEMQEELRRETTQDSSTLDLYKDGQVATHEINKVVQIRKICGLAGHSRFASDWLVLQVLRSQRGDQVAAAQAVQALLAWRRKYGAASIKRQLLTQDMAWDDIPNLGKVNSVLPYVDVFKVDEQNTQLVQYAYIGARADYSCLLRLVREDDLCKCALHVAERTLLLLETISNRTGRVFEPTILCDARGEPDKEGLELFIRLFRSVCGALSHYPVRPKLILWQPGASLAGLAHAYPYAHAVHSKKMLRILLSPDCIPEELGGQLRFGKQSDQLSKVDPWQLRQCRFPPLSRVLGHSEIDLHFFQDVSAAEANAVVALKGVLSVVERQARSGETIAPISSSSSRRRGSLLRSRGKSSEGEVSLPTLRRRMRAFRAEGGALHMVSNEVASHLMLLRFVRKFMSSSELKRYGELPNLRLDGNSYTRAAPGILAAAIAYVEMLSLRLKLGLDEHNTRIKSDKLALCEAHPGVVGVCAGARLRPLMGYDAAQGQILAFHAENSRPAKAEKASGLSQDDMLATCAVIFEYWLIMLHAISSQEERVISVRDLAYLSKFGNCLARPWASFHQAMQELCSTYPNCVKADQAVLVPMAKVRGPLCAIANKVLRTLGSSNWFEPSGSRRPVLLLEKAELSTVMSVALLPADLGGQSTFGDVSNQALGTALAHFSSALQQTMPLWSAPEGALENRFVSLPGFSSGAKAPLIRESAKMYMPIRLPRFYTDTHLKRPEKSPLELLMKGHTLLTLSAARPVQEHEATTRPRNAQRRQGAEIENKIDEPV